jgi:hypothetical protein
MALFISLDPAIPTHMRPVAILLVLMGLMLGLSTLALLCTLLTIHAQQSAGADAASGPRRSA